MTDNQNPARQPNTPGVYGPYVVSFIGPAVWAAITDELPPELVDKKVWVTTTPPPENHVTGIELAARFIEKRLKDYVDEFGSTDPETGTVEFPGNGDEYVGELEEIIEGIRALASEKQA